MVRRHEKSNGGVLILDDCIEDKPYTDENEIMCWHYSHAHNRQVKGVNIISCLVRYGDVSLPVGYEIILKDIQFSDVKTKKIKRQSSISKNEHFRNLIKQATKNDVSFEYVMADNWFGSKENLNFINYDIKKKFIIGIKSNRTVALSEEDKYQGKFQSVGKLDLKDGH